MGGKIFCRGIPPSKGKNFWHQILLDTCSDWEKKILSRDPPPSGIARNCYGYAAGGMPLAFTQEDFLVKRSIYNFLRNSLISLKLEILFSMLQHTYSTVYGCRVSANLLGFQLIYPATNVHFVSMFLVFTHRIWQEFVDGRHIVLDSVSGLSSI